MTLTKSNIADAIHKQIGFPQKKCSEMVETMLEIMKRSLEDGDDVLISGFGKFCVNDKADRKGRNPATGEDMMLRKRRVVTFKCSSVLREKISGDSA